MVGRLLSFWGPAHFQVRSVSFREGNRLYCSAGKVLLFTTFRRHSILENPPCVESICTVILIAFLLGERMFFPCLLNVQTQKTTPKNPEEAALEDSKKMNHKDSHGFFFPNPKKPNKNHTPPKEKNAGGFGTKRPPQVLASIHSIHRFGGCFG